ncbi:MAG: two-component system, chemotaxis family, protein-glutamate methylesterase/glutaminase [Solirubrobacteraceae bacterium]|nr:two-component system, chemotaxis family, protein-glutamate methylesterase/glutaminase [Solirubrobacteraceae bacterium]
MGRRTLEEHPPVRDLVVIGASAGGVEALKRLVGDLPEDLPAAVCVVLHIAPTSTSALAGILDRAGPLPCSPAVDDEPLRPGHIVVAPPDRHLLIEDGRARLGVGPRENGHRPAVDALFRSAAEARWHGVVGVVLSGTRDDGSAGLAVIKSRGGAAVVQDPEDALYAGMPRSALAHVPVDAVAPIGLLAQSIVSLVRGEALPGDVRASDPELARGPEHQLITVCPECGGVLTERDEAGMPGWRCHVGHLYSPRSLVEAQGAAVEAALWTALRSLEDRGALLRRMTEQAETRGQRNSAAMFNLQSEQVGAQADLLRGVLRERAAPAQRAFSESETDEPMAAGEHA